MSIYRREEEPEKPSLPSHLERPMRNAKVLFALAIAALVVAVSGLLLFWMIAPDEGSSTEDTFGITIAIAGVLVGVFAGSTAIYAQLKGLWPHAPRWLRIGAYLAMGVAAIVALTTSTTG